MTLEESMKIFNERKWNYYFDKGKEVMLDERIITENSHYPTIPLWPFLGMKGKVISCIVDMHAFGRGSSYIVTVDFEGTTVGPIMSYNLIPYKEADIKT